MELITNILIEYLKHNKRIVVPKLGAFIVKQQSGVVRFCDLMRNDDGVLRSLLVAYGMNELEANGKIDRFVFEIRHAIGQKQSFMLEGFGEFRAGDNNTITFIHSLEPRVIGGNIKPPLEILNIEKQKLQLSATQTKAQEERSTSEKRHKTKNRTEEDSVLTLSKPDSYLRGLNYDDRKKRSEERKDKRRKPMRVSPIAVILVIVIIAGVGYGGWRWYSDTSANTTPQPRDYTVEEVIPTVVDSLMMATPADSLQYAPIDMADSLNVVTNQTTL